MIVYQLMKDNIGILTDEEGYELFFDSLEQAQGYVIDKRIDCDGLRVLTLDTESGEYTDD